MGRAEVDPRPPSYVGVWFMHTFLIFFLEWLHRLPDLLYLDRFLGERFTRHTYCHGRCFPSKSDGGQKILRWHLGAGSILFSFGVYISPCLLCIFIPLTTIIDRCIHVRMYVQ